MHKSINTRNRYEVIINLQQGLTAKNLFCIEKEYDDMVNALNGNDLHTRDVFRYHKNYNPITYGDKDPETGMMETVLTHVEDHGSRQSLDYIFECFWKKEIKALNVEGTFTLELKSKYIGLLNKSI